MHRTTVVLLQPTARQDRALQELLGAQCELYNAALEERRGAWRWEARSVNRAEQYRELNGWDHPVRRFGVTPARGTLLRLERAFDGFFRRVKAGGKPGFPRFRSVRRWDSAEYPDAKSWKITERGRCGRLYLQGVGHVAYRGSRRGVLGTPKTLVVKREGHRFRAYVSCEMEAPEPLAPTGRQVGIDVGVDHLLASSDGALVENERFTKRSLRRLGAAQALVAGRKRGSARQRKAAEAVGRIQRKVARQRRDAAHRLSRALVDDYDLIVHERLQITNMVRRPRPVPDASGGYAPNGAGAKAGLNREILSAGWAQLLAMVSYKAAEAGRSVIAVEARHTSQRCHRCGHVDPDNRAGAVFRCMGCGHRDHADINAAKNILRAGLALRLEREA